MNEKVESISSVQTLDDEELFKKYRALKKRLPRPSVFSFFLKDTGD